MNEKIRNYNISYFLVLMHSPLISKRNIINGHAIYNALLRSGKINPDEILKISFGISQNIPISLKGSNKYLINVEEEDKIPIRKEKKIKIKPTIIDNLTEKGYDGFVALRKTENNFTNPLYDFSPIPFKVIKSKHTELHDDLISHCISYFTFYIIWKNEVPSIDFKNMEFGLGKARNNGFGFSRIEKVVNITTDQLLSKVDGDLFDTTLKGILGIYNHKKYGFGEYIIENNKWFKLTTPLCMESSLKDTGKYTFTPSCTEIDNYIISPYYLWDDNHLYELKVINAGKTFILKKDKKHG